MRKMTFIISVILLATIVAACGGNGASSSSGSSSASDTNAAPVVATMPPARFTAVAQQSVTNTVDISSTASQTQTTAANAPDLARGALAYEKNKCADCHGAQGEGVADKGNAIAGTALTLSEFENKLRTGGGLGNSHIFGPSAVSRTGMEILYLYVQSLDD